MSEFNPQRVWLRRGKADLRDITIERGKKMEELWRGSTSNFHIVITQGYVKKFSNSKYFLEM